MNKSIALIGGGGFIGTNLANFFLQQGYNVLVISRRPIEQKNFISVKIINLIIDINQTSKLVYALKEYENVVWLVNNLLPGFKMDSLAEDFIINVNPMIRFLELFSKEFNSKRFIFISSGGTVYGNSNLCIPHIETNILKPISAYGLSKFISENYIDFITSNSDLDSYILRPSNVYGNFQNMTKPQGVIGYAFNAVVNNSTIDLFGDGAVTRDFLHVFDLAKAVECCVLQPCLGSHVEKYNVGSGKGTTIRELLDNIKFITNKDLDILNKPLREFDCIYNVLDISKINSSFGWKPTINIENGLQLVWNWMGGRVN
jgi:UDP-glucose 4-epimerase